MNTIILVIGLVYFIVINVIAFLTYGWDKHRAIKHQWRIPEATLILLGFLGGAVGAMIGRKIWHHKTQKIKFKVCVPISLVVTILLMLAVLFWSYVSAYYKAGDVALDTMKQAEKISLDGDYVFAPEQPSCGLVLYPGAKVDNKAYAPLAKELSEQGILCAVVSMPAHIAFFDEDAASDVMAKYPDIKEWYVGGHSLGGVVATSYVSKHLDDCKGMILLASYSTNNLQNENLRTLSIYGTEDQVLNRDSYEEHKSNLPTLKEFVIEGGNHAQFGDYGEQKGDGAATITASEQWMKTVNQIVSFVK